MKTTESPLFLVQLLIVVLLPSFESTPGTSLGMTALWFSVQYSHGIVASRVMKKATPTRNLSDVNLTAGESPVTPNFNAKSESRGKPALQAVVDGCPPGWVRGKSGEVLVKGAKFRLWGTWEVGHFTEFVSLNSISTFLILPTFAGLQTSHKQ